MLRPGDLYRDRKGLFSLRPSRLCVFDCPSEALPATLFHRPGPPTVRMRNKTAEMRTTQGTAPGRGLCATVARRVPGPQRTVFSAPIASLRFPLPFRNAPTNPISPYISYVTRHLIDTGASARCLDAATTLNRFQRFVAASWKPLKRLDDAPPAPHRAEAPVLMKPSHAARKKKTYEHPMLECHSLAGR